MRSALRFVLATVATLLALPAAADAAAWKRVPAAPLAGLVRAVEPERFATFTVDRTALRRSLSAGSTVAIPAPNGRLARFRVHEASVMEPGLQRRHPEIRTYTGHGLTDRTATIKLSVTPLGVHASVLGARSAWYVDPRYRGNAVHHVSYLRSALPQRDPHEREAPVPGGAELPAPDAAALAAAAEPGETTRLRIYRLALVTDPGYARNSGAVAGLDPEAPDYLERLNDRVTAAKAVLMNRVNQLYEADFSLRMILIDATDRLNLNTTDLATQPGGPCGPVACFTSSEISSCRSLNRNQFVTGIIAGARNYDLGHYAGGAGSGGVAGLGVVGQAAKSRGCTALNRPVGDFFAVDYVAHEIGHQFGGNHTFNGVNGSCVATNRNLAGTAAVEPGSGTTVMAYAGICDTDDLQPHSDPYFSQYSIREMNRYMFGSVARLNSVQQVGLVDFEPGAHALTLGYGDRSTAVGAYSAAGVKAAIESLLPEGGTVTVTGLNGAAFGPSGFQATFGGTLAGEPVELLAATVTGARAVVGETVAGGPTTKIGIRSEPSANRAPGVTAPATVSVPPLTPFALTAQGTDPDGDALTYLWEQNDGGPPAVGDLLLNPARVTGPLFRVFGTAARYGDDAAYQSPSPGMNLAGTEPSRAFPDVAQVAAGNTNQLGACPSLADGGVSEALTDCLSEQLPTAAWLGLDGTGTMHFYVTARDNRGGVAQAAVDVALDKALPPFRVLAARPSAADARQLAVAWTPHTALLSPNVRISLSTDGGKTFPTVLAARTPNDGQEQMALPAGLRSTTARVKVEAVEGVFFDVSHEDAAIDAAR